jgi:hypothetical protein
MPKCQSLIVVVCQKPIIAYTASALCLCTAPGLRILLRLLLKQCVNFSSIALTAPSLQLWYKACFT